MVGKRPLFAVGCWGYDSRTGVTLLLETLQGSQGSKWPRGECERV